MTARKNPLVDGRKVRSNASHCPHGHPFNSANTRYVKTGANAGHRYCAECGRIHALNGYQRRKAENPEEVSRQNKIRRDRWRKDPANLLKSQQKRQAWYLRNVSWSRVRARMQLYGLTLDQYHAVYERDDFACHICGTEDNLGIDHDHITGKVRRLLCNGCNAGIGHFRENPAFLRAAAIYTETKC